MFECLLNDLEHTDEEKSLSNIRKFLHEKSNATSMPELDDGNLRERLWSALFVKIASQISPTDYLTAIKILGRDKTDLSTLITEDRLKVLLKCAKLNPEEDHNKLPDDYPCVVEALKCLCNSLLNFYPAAEVLNKNDIAVSVIKRISAFQQVGSNHEIKLFHFKLFFLLTALCEEARFKVYTDSNGLKLFTDTLQEELNLAKKVVDEKNTTLTFNEDQTALVTEVLKILFNVMMDIPEGPNFNEDDVKQLTNVLREYLLAECKPHTWKLQNDIINLLTIIPKENLDCLILPGYQISETNLEHNEAFSAIQNIINFLDFMLITTENSKTNKQNPKDVLSPVLLVLLHSAQSNRLFRKYIRLKILPNLTQVFSRPEEGSTLRNKLCRLLTSPVDAVKELTEDFLFILCKENVGRMVKYTGYGNAAGMLHRRGLMNAPLEYSSDSEDSETEEYSQNKHLINPIVGCRPASQTEEIETFIYYSFI